MATYVGAQVIDTQTNQPAAGIAIALQLPDGSVKKGRTDEQGRARVDSDLAGGIYTFTFLTGPWFAAQERATCYPEIVLSVDVAADEDFLVTVLLSSFAYTTYRGTEKVDNRPGWLKALS